MQSNAQIGLIQFTSRYTVRNSLPIDIIKSVNTYMYVNVYKSSVDSYSRW